ncbi:UBC-like protein [Sistotremastrum niveocremeum HHB9708]|uniref:E2 ubiquitin-conjugating enzyme n=2 Tax=Sistotremastraceae TaxID=3402574 RepID=A0A165AHM2_9AGAM|nr:UBC-like protein [Sistotremastrum niveocremeum HHB9708]KZT44108.1 UBC-like protein [Sistotremastrum suecicum HHB10207 ss-3]
MANPRIKRLTKEILDLSNKPLQDISISQDEDDVMKWTCHIKAAPESPYKGGTFKFTMNFPAEYPFKAPSVKFLTKIYHPGINDQGEICIGILRDDWKPSISASTILATIQEKVNNPSPDDPYEPEIAAELKNNKTKFLSVAKEWTKKYAT